MTTTTEPAETPDARDLRAAIACFETSLDLARAAMDRLRRDPAAAGAVAGDIVALRKALQILLEERKRFDVLAGTLGGDGADVSVPEIDLAAARAEIRRRLDRLRDAGGGGGVS
jgi:hypothetical protein